VKASITLMLPSLRDQVTVFILVTTGSSSQDERGPSVLRLADDGGASPF
jgi:hypothetical protein